MLAFELKQYEKLLFTVPTFVQPKLDGVRCILNAGELTTRAGKPIVSCPHLAKEYYLLDGELYNHELKEDFNKIISLVRKTKPTKEDIEEAYGGVDQWYDLSSEWIYFKKNDLSYTIFVNAEMYYEENKLKVRAFAGDRPDEPYFNLALISVGHKPHQAPYQPTYWQPAMKGFPGVMGIKKGWMAFSVGGKTIPQQQQVVYDELAKNASFRMNMPSMKIAQKMNQLSERKVI